jgi:hypothetical protein
MGVGASRRCCSVRHASHNVCSVAPHRGGGDERPLVALHRSAAMCSPRQRIPVEREQLLERLGTDLRAVAAHAGKPPGHCR